MMKRHHLYWAALMACGGGGGEESGATGQVVVTLQASIVGTTYRLSEATMTGTGPEAFTLDSSDAAQVSIGHDLVPGAYALELQDGWALERQSGEAFAPVSATVSSPNPVSFTVGAAQIARVGYAFETGGITVDLRQSAEDGGEDDE